MLGWGANNYGQLGASSRSDRSRDVGVVVLCGFAEKRDAVEVSELALECMLTSSLAARRSRPLALLPHHPRPDRGPLHPLAGLHWVQQVGARSVRAHRGRRQRQLLRHALEGERRRPARCASPSPCPLPPPLRLCASPSSPKTDSQLSCRRARVNSARSATASGRTRRRRSGSRRSAVCASVRPAPLAPSTASSLDALTDRPFVHPTGNEQTGKVEFVGIKDVQAGEGHVAVVLVRRCLSSQHVARPLGVMSWTPSCVVRASD